MWRFVFWCSSQFCEQKNALIIIVFALITNSALNSAKKIEYRAKNFQKRNTRSPNLWHDKAS